MKNVGGDSRGPDDRLFVKDAGSDQKSGGRLLGLLPVLGAVFLFSCLRDPAVRKAEYLNEGKRYFATGKYNEAVIEYRNAIQIDPRYAEAHYQLGRAYLSKGNTEAAYREFTAAVTLDPADREAKLQLAGLLVRQGKYSEGQTIAQEIAKADPGNLGAHMILGEKYAATRDFPDAVEELRKAVAIDPGSVQTYIALGSIYSAAGRTAEAEGVYRKAIDANPKSSPAHIAFGQFYFSLGKMTEAEDELKAAWKLDPQGVTPGLLLGKVYSASRRYNDAERLYAGLKTLAPDDPEAYEALAIFYADTGQKEKALDELKILATAKPKDLTVRALLAETLIDMQRIEEAAAGIEEPLRKNPDNARLLLSEGRIFLAERKYGPATQALQKAVTIDPSSGDGFYFLGIAQKSNGLRDAARNSFTRAKGLMPHLGQAEAALASLDLSSQGPDAAARLADQAIAKSPGLATPYVAKAMAVIARGDPQQGAKLIDEALRRDPVSLAALATLLKLSITQGKTTEVVQRLSILRDRHPENAGLSFLLALGQFSLRDLDKSEANVRRAIKLDAQTRGAYALLGQIDLARGSAEKAKLDLQNAVAANPTVLSNYASLGALYERENNWQEAKQLFQKAHEMDPGSPSVSAELAFLYLEHGGDVNVAVSLAQMAKQKMPDSPMTADALGWAYYKLGSLDLAIAQLKESTTKVPDNPVYQYHLGMAYLRARRVDLAAQSLRTALKENPNFHDAESARTGLSEIAQLKR